MAEFDGGKVLESKTWSMWLKLNLLLVITLEGQTVAFAYCLSHCVWRLGYVCGWCTELWTMCANVSLCWSVTVWFFSAFFVVVIVCLLFGHGAGGGAGGMSNIKPMWATCIRSHKWTACSWMGIWPLIFVFEVVSVWWPFVTRNLWKEKNGHKKWVCAGEENYVEG